MRYYATLVATLALALSAQAASAAKPNPGQPLRGSFIEDFVHAKAQLAAATSLATITCEFDPCTLRDDFDGDGQRDLAFQFVRSDVPGAPGTVGTPGIAIALTGGNLFLFGGGMDNSGIDAALSNMQGLGQTWSCAGVAQLLNPPAMTGNGILVEDLLLHHDGTTFVILPNMARRP